MAICMAIVSLHCEQVNLMQLSVCAWGLSSGWGIPVQWQYDIFYFHPWPGYVLCFVDSIFLYYFRVLPCFPSLILFFRSFLHPQCHPIGFQWSTFSPFRAPAVLSNCDHPHFSLSYNMEQYSLQWNAMQLVLMSFACHFLLILDLCVCQLWYALLTVLVRLC